MIQRILELAKTRFGVKAGVVIATLTVIVFASNPEILSFVILVNAIGIDVFLLFLSFQLRAHAELAYRFAVYPVLLHFRSWNWRKKNPRSAGSAEG